MPLIFRIKKADGSYDMVEQKQPEPLAEVVIQQPESTTGGIQAGLKRYSCTACVPPRPFGGLGVLSMHFAKKHPELSTDKDSWRKYVSEFGQTGATHDT